MKKVITGIVFASMAVAAASWMPLKTWQAMTGGLLVFFGLLVAALVQVIPVTTNFLQADTLTLQEATRLTKALENQQRYWLGLLGFSAATCVTLIVGMALNEDIFVPISAGQANFSISLHHLYSGFVGGMVGIVFLKMFDFFPGVLSLQRLRSQLVITAARRRQAEKAQEEMAAIQQKAEYTKPIIPPDYGRIIRPH